VDKPGIRLWAGPNELVLMPIIHRLDHSRSTDFYRLTCRSGLKNVAHGRTVTDPFLFAEVLRPWSDQIESDHGL